MGKVKIRYYSVRSAWKNSRTWGYWVPTKRMKALGFHTVACGEDGPAAWAVAERWNARWDETQRAVGRGGKVEPPGPGERIYPAGSLGEAYARFRALKTWSEKKPRTREDWERGWKRIDPIFGDLDPSLVSLEDLDAWYAALLDTAGVREAHRAMKIWRAMWKVVGTLKKPDGGFYCDAARDPSLGIRRKTPQARDAIWLEGEAVRLVKAAWRMGYHGLAAALAVAWDTMLSPVDVRALTTSAMRRDADGPMFETGRTKTGKAAVATLGRRAARLLDAYMAGLPFTLHPDTPIFHTRGGEPGPKGGRPRPPAPYTKDTLGDDFRVVRESLFPGDKRKLMDFRRSGAIEAVAGGADAAALAGKMANSIDQSRALQDAYLPQKAAVVRLADRARAAGRGRLRGSTDTGGRS